MKYLTFANTTKYINCLQNSFELIDFLLLTKTRTRDCSKRCVQFVHFVCGQDLLEHSLEQKFYSLKNIILKF